MPFSVSAEAATLKCLMNIEIIHLVNDEELMPIAMLDYHWEKLLKKDYSESEDWWNEFYHLSPY